MASFTGQMVGLPHRIDDTLRCSATIAAMSVDNPTLLEPISMIDGLSKGVYSNNKPIAEYYINRTGVEAPAFSQDYYNRVHVSPQEIALGAVLSPIQEEFIVWNAHFVSKRLNSITTVNPDEFTLGGQTPPHTLGALEWLTYTIDVPKDGSVEFTSSLTFNFTSESPTVTITGIRIVAFPWPPLLNMEETLKWNTQIIKGRSGYPQRISVRTIPRQGFGIDAYLKDEQEQAKFEAKLFSWQKRNWGLPIWGEWVEHTGTINAGDMTISVDTTNADFRDDSLAIVYVDSDNYEAVKVATKTDSALTLEVEMQNTFTGPKTIIPVRVVKMVRPAKCLMAPDGYAYASCEFLATDNALVTGYSAAETYKGLTVLTKATYVPKDGQELESDADVSIVDYGFGSFDMHSDSDFNEVVQTHIFKNWTKAECWEFRQFLHSLYGRQKPVWIPTFKNDMQLTQTMGAAELNFRITNIGLTDNMGLNTLRTNIAFMFPNGTNYYREILGIVESGSEEIISIDSQLGVQIEPGDCEICFLDKYVLASDLVKIVWQEPFRNICQLRFVRVED